MVSNTTKTLIHTALLCEAQAFIQLLKLKKINSKLYENERYSLLISGIGKENTQKHLRDIFKIKRFSKAFNIGVAGCKDENIDIGTLFCTTHKELKNIAYASLSTADKALNSKEQLLTTLVDMEAKYFIQICEKHILKESIYSFKVVSDYLSAAIPKKALITALIQKNLPLIKEII